MLAAANRTGMLVAIIAFAVGYWLVSFLFQQIKAGRDRRSSPRLEPRSDALRTDGDPAEDHARVLGIEASASQEEIKRAYLEQLSKYHPDKVSHLGAEFREMASEKTRRIIEAYEYFRGTGRG